MAWDTLPDNWSVGLLNCDDDLVVPGDAKDPAFYPHPLATKSGMHAFHQILTADMIWRNLTKPQRELLLSSAAECPIKARVDVTRRLIGRGLLAADPFNTDTPAAITPAGRFVVAWRTP